MNANSLSRPAPALRRPTFWILVAMLLAGFIIMFRAYDPAGFAYVINAIRSFFRLCHDLYQEFKYFEWMTAVIGLVSALIGLRLHYRYQTWKRNKRVNARVASFMQIKHLVEERGAKVTSLGMTTKSRTGISTFHLMVGPGGEGDQLFAIEVDTKNAPALHAGEYPVVEYRNDCVIFWLKTGNGRLAPKTFNL